MSSVGRCRSLGTLVYRQIFAGLLPTSRSGGCSRRIFNAFSSKSENENASEKEIKDEKVPKEETEVEKLMAAKDSLITEKENEIKDMKVS